MELATGGGVLVPESLHRFCPSLRLLDLVDHEHPAGVAGFDAGILPFLRNPPPAAEGGFIGAR